MLRLKLRRSRICTISFRFGGTVELAVSDDGVKAGKPYKHRLVMTEILWGLNMSASGAPRAMPQWIEIYNNRTLTDAEALVDDPATTKFEGPQPATPTDPATNNTSYILIFTENNRMDRVGSAVKYKADNTGTTDDHRC